MVSGALWRPSRGWDFQPFSSRKADTCRRFSGQIWRPSSLDLKRFASWRRRERERVSERRWCARADDFARFGADAAETMRAAALEIISVAGSEDPAFAIHSHLESAAEDDAAFLAIVNQRDTSGVATRFVTLLQDLERAAEQVIADLTKGDRSFADFAQLVGTVKRLARPVGLEREEFRHSHRDAIQNALERADRGIHLVGFDQRDRRVGHPGTLGQLTLG